MNWISELAADFQNLDTGKGKLRNFGILLAGLCIAIFGYLLLFGSGSIESSSWLLGIALLFFLLGLLSPAGLKWPYKVWMGIAFILGSIISRIVLTIVFWFFITPIAVVARLFGKRFFISYNDAGMKSYWIERSSKKTNYEQMF